MINLKKIGLAAFGATGAGIGAMYGSISNSGSTAQGAALGAVAGASVVPAIGAAFYGGYQVANNVEKIGQAAFGAVKGVGKAGSAFAESLTSTNRFVNPLGSVANGIAKASNKLVKYAPAKEAWNVEKGILERKEGSLKLSNWGKTFVGVSAIATGASNALNTFEQSRMGTQDDYVTTSTPITPSYKDNAGASGDLVFALNANRRG